MSGTETPNGTGTSTNETPVGTAAANPAGIPAPTDWHAGLSDDLKGYVSTKGFKDPASVVDSYRNLEKLIGVKEKLLQVPDNLGDEKAMADVWKRLGRPEKAEEYGIKAENEKLGKWYAETAHKLGLNRNQAEALFKSFDEYAKAEAMEIENQTKANSEKLVNELKTKWGAAYEQNLAVAQSAAKQFGITPEQVSQLETVMGFQPVMELLNNIGAKIGEPDFVGGTGAKGFGTKVLPPAQARERINQLMQDSEWSKRYINGDMQARNEFENLNKWAIGQT